MKLPRRFLSRGSPWEMNLLQSIGSIDGLCSRRAPMCWCLSLSRCRKCRGFAPALTANFSENFMSRLIFAKLNISFAGRRRPPSSIGKRRFRWMCVIRWWIAKKRGVPADLSACGARSFPIATICCERAESDVFLGGFQSLGLFSGNMVIILSGCIRCAFGKSWY